MERKNVYFLSDLHLGASYLKDEHEAERRVCRFLDQIKDDAAEIFLVGDVLDYWYEYRTVVPRGYVRFFGKIAELTDAGVKVTWLIGNHDIWIFDYLPSELGVVVVDGPLVRSIDGRRFYIAHGDGVGRRSLSFRFTRAMFRNRLCQRLYSSIHPRWTVPFAHAWSSKSRDCGSNPSEVKKAVDALVAFARKYVRKKGRIDWFVFGHLHVAVEREVSPESTLVVLGDWIDHFTYARFDGTRLDLYAFEAEEAAAGTDVTPI